jgi:hypothetical protein
MVAVASQLMLELDRCGHHLGRDRRGLVVDVYESLGHYLSVSG